MNGISALDYLKKFFREIVKERRDYENLLPMTIGISTNNINNQLLLLIYLKGNRHLSDFPIPYVKIGRLPTEQFIQYAKMQGVCLKKIDKLLLYNQ